MKIQLISIAVQLPVLLSEARDFLKISQQDEDAIITSYIRAATDACESFIGRKLIKQQWQLTFNDWNDGVIQIPLSPILTIDKIEYWNAGAFQEITATNYLLDDTSYQAKILPQLHYQWPDPARNIAGIRITVSAGFGEGQNDIPHDIRQGLLHWVAAVYDGGEHIKNQSTAIAEKLWQPYRCVAL